MAKPTIALDVLILLPFIERKVKKFINKNNKKTPSKKIGV